MTDPTLALAGRTIVVFGGAGRLGTAFSEDIAAAGGRPIIADYDAEVAERAAATIGNGPTQAVGLRTDITDTASVEAAFAEVADRFGRIDGIVNSAYPRNANYGRKFEDVTYADFAENMSGHVAGMFLTCQRYHAHQRRAGRGGSIVNIASIYGIVAPRFEVYAGTPMTMPVEYAAIKAAVIHLTRYMAKYFFGTGIRVNCVSPGGILDGQPDMFVENYRRFCAERGMLDRHDITGAVNFLLSEQSQYVNGQNLVVDDGFSL